MIRERMMDPNTRWKLLEQRRKLRKSRALKSALDQPNKKHEMMKKQRTIDFKAKLSKGISLISTTTGGIQKINVDQENTYTHSSSGEVLVFCCNNKILNTDDTQIVKKALSAAMLTSRYAEILSKRKADKADLQKERERQQCLIKRKEDKATEQLKKKQAADLRVKQREAARVALELVERTVEFEDNLMILKELEKLSQCSHTYIHRGGYNGPAVMVLRGLASGSRVFNPLEQLGLYMKEEEFVMEDDEETFFCQDVEEGEIVQY